MFFLVGCCYDFGMVCYVFCMVLPGFWYVCYDFGMVALWFRCGCVMFLLWFSLFLGVQSEIKKSRISLFSAFKRKQEENREAEQCFFARGSFSFFISEFFGK